MYRFYLLQCSLSVKTGSGSYAGVLYAKNTANPPPRSDCAYKRKGPLACSPNAHFRAGSGPLNRIHAKQKHAVPGGIRYNLH